MVEEYGKQIVETSGIEHYFFFTVSQRNMGMFPGVFLVADFFVLSNILRLNTDLQRLKVYLLLENFLSLHWGSFNYLEKL